MSKEYRARTFKSGNSVALRLPKALGVREGENMILREEGGKFEFKPEPPPTERISLEGIYGAMKGLKRQPFDHKDRDWSVKLDADD